jgi:hypothetical protein
MPSKETTIKDLHASRKSLSQELDIAKHNIEALQSDRVVLQCNTPSTPGLAVLTPDSSLGSYIVPTNQHKSFVCNLSSLMRTRENFPVDHPSQIAPSQARLTWRFFQDRLPKKDAPCWYGYSINSIKP